MRRFEGRCVGGPMDGQWLTHSSSTHEVAQMQPVGEAIVGETREAKVEFGHYSHHGATWRWHAPGETTSRVADFGSLAEARRAGQRVIEIDRLTAEIVGEARRLGMGGAALAALSPFVTRALREARL